MRLLGLSLALAAGVQSFSVTPRFSTPESGRRDSAAPFATTATALWSSAPSDSGAAEEDYSEYGYGSESATTLDAVAAAVEDQAQGVVSDMLNLMPGDAASFADVTPAQRASITEALFQLEAINPTSSPAMSALLNGVWELKYVGGYASDWALPSPTRQLALFAYSGGYSPGVFCYTLAQGLPKQLIQTDDVLEITISRSNPRIEASIGVKLFGGAVDSAVTVKARLEVESDVRLRETYESASVMGQSPLEIPSQLQYSRDLFITYLDEDLLVVRDGSGVPEVLVRKEKKFQKNWGTEPSAIDDMVPPGDGVDASY